MIVVVVAALFASASCAEARAALEAPAAASGGGDVVATADEARARASLALSLLPASAEPLATQLTGELARTEVDPRAVLARLSRVLADGCAARAPFDDVDAQLARILADPRFSGVRPEKGLIEQLLQWLFEWVAPLFETEGMKQYANAARGVYLALLVVAVVVIGWRIVRARRRAVHAEPMETLAVVEAARQRAFAELLREAQALRAAGDLRGAVRAARDALLARIGELEIDVVTPARTHREILARVARERALLLEGALTRFDVLFYGGRIDAPGTDGFLDDVVRAERALGAPR